MSALDIQVGEQWRPISGNDGYEVSNLGSIRSWLPVRRNAKRPTTPRVLKGSPDKNGYIRFTLYDGLGGQTYVRACAVVCSAWHGERPEGMVVRHLNGINNDDRPENLRWGTPKENSADTIVHGTWVHGQKVNTAKLTEADVIEIRRTKGKAVDLASSFNVCPSTISHIRTGRTWGHVK